MKKINIVLNLKKLKKISEICLIFLLIVAWLFSGWPQLWQNSPFPPEVLTSKAASPEAFAYTGSTQNFNPANGIYAVDVECWGGGGGGGRVNNSAGGGGGGGAYAKSTAVVVAPGSSYAVVIGAGGASETNGDNSTFNGTTVVAVGGGAAADAANGTGGLAGSSTGNSITSSGGDGGDGYDQGATGAGAGGGGAGGPNGAGKVGANATATLPTAGGDGNNSTGTGTGGTIVDGGAGNPGGDDLTYGGGGGAGSEGGQVGGAGGVPGGGGGGGSDNAVGGAGGHGRCIVSYTDTWAPSVSQTSYDNAWTFATAPNNDAGGQISMAATPGYDYNTISYSFAFTACASDGGTGGASSGWQAGASYSDTGLDPNKCYGYTVQTKDSLENTGTASSPSETYSSANVPGQPTLGSATATTLTLTNDANGNPAAGPITLFAVKVVTGDAGWINNWVNAAGEPVGSEDWLRDDQLDGLIIGSGGTPLTAETTYGVQVEAKNGNGDITILGPEGQGVTLAGAADYLYFSVTGNETFSSLAPGTLVATTSILSMRTNYANGLYVTVQRDDPDTTMDLATDETINLTDKTAWSLSSNVCADNGGNATASTTQPQTLQFRVRQSGTDADNYCANWWGSDDTTANAKFAGFPSSAVYIINRGSAAVSSTTAYALYNLDAPATQKTGAYAGSITYTATANP